MSVCLSFPPLALAIILFAGLETGVARIQGKGWWENAQVAKRAPVAGVRSTHIFVLWDLVSRQEPHFCLCIMAALDARQTSASTQTLPLLSLTLSLSRALSVCVLACFSRSARIHRISRCQTSCSCHGSREAGTLELRSQWVTRDSSCGASAGEQQQQQQRTDTTY